MFVSLVQDYLDTKTTFSSHAYPHFGECRKPDRLTPHHARSRHRTVRRLATILEAFLPQDPESKPVDCSPRLGLSTGFKLEQTSRTRLWKCST